ncbi:MAG: phage tail tape measure protein, partial [Campylobacter sp.]|nr:phage tail tape measure protein [Campylobacter sp.]
TPKAKEALQSLGYSVEGLEKAMSQNPQETILSFLETVKTMPNQDKQLGVLTDIFGTGFSGDIALLVNGLDTYKKALDDVKKEESKDAMQKEADNRAKTTANSLILLKNSLRELADTIGSVFLPFIATLAKALAKVVASVADFIGQFPKLNKVVGFLTIGFLAFKPLFLGLKFAYFSFMGGILSSIKTLTMLQIRLKLVGRAIIFCFSKSKLMLIGAYNIALKALTLVCGGVVKALRALAIGIRVVSVALITNPIGLILAAIAAIAALIILNWDKVKAWFLGFIEWIKPVFEPVVNHIKAAWSGLGEFFSSLIDGIKAIFEPFFNWIEAKFGWISDTYKSISSGVTSLGDGIKGGFDRTMSFFGFGDSFKNDDTTLIQSAMLPATAISPSQNYNFNFGDINPNIDENGLKRAVIKEIDRQSLNAYNRNFVNGGD